MKPFSLFIGLFISCWVVTTSHAYTSPDFRWMEENFVDDPDRQILMNTDLARSLLEVAVHVRIDPRLFRERAMALAWAVASLEEQENLAKADFYFRLKRLPEDDPLIGVVPSAEDLIEAMGNSAKFLSAEGVSSSETGFVALVRELLQELNWNNGKPVDLGFEVSRNMVTKNMWAEIISDPSNRDASITRGDDFTGVDLDLPETGVNSAEMLAGEGIFKGKQSTLNGLLVISLPGSEFAGDASRMNATAAGSDLNTEPTEIRFSQSVGPMMSGALSEVERFIAVRHDGIPKGNQVTISFDERNTMKDGPSAAVACALLIDSLITGTQLDSGFAVTGDMNADGKVQPVGGIDGKVRGAARAGCSHVALPAENMKEVSDILILEGPTEICEIQIFSISEFDEAKALAMSPETRSPELAESLKLFGEIASVILRPGGAQMVSNPHVIERLRKVLQLTPNHYSAELLLRSALGSAPESLSLSGSFTALDRCLKPMEAVRKSRDFSSRTKPLKDSIANLRRVRSLLDPRTKPVSDGIEDFYDALSSIESGMQREGPRYRLAMQEISDALDRLDAAYAALRTDPEVQAELNL